MLIGYDQVDGINTDEKGLNCLNSDRISVYGAKFFTNSNPDYYFDSITDTVVIV